MQDDQSGRHFVNYHESLQQDPAPTAGVLALGISETPTREKSAKKEGEVEVLKIKIAQLESEAAQKGHDNSGREGSFPFLREVKKLTGTKSNSPDKFRNTSN